ncbi:hypothetical protein HNR23_002315 [Nocardiopsis mwathae]|uniref:Uncharacterized protein n=1 Tax=Nocardiopsis mwathae TaxID=1472723 RepID=A0A7W9YHH5_9ACTN|nr:hypothetical protein [Nocardiopsis mwathae]MBB6172255.1 hypothetical protein [Nocardiopsis mwathae]
MSTPENIRNIEHLGALTLALGEAVSDLEKHEVTAVHAEADYKLAQARAFRDAVGSVEARKMAAVEACDQLFRTWGEAAAVVTAQKAHIRALHTRIDVGRTKIATVRAEVSLAGYGGAA